MIGLNLSTNETATGAFWSAEQDDDHPHRYHYTAPPEACVGPEDHQFFMGGVAMASAIDALQRWSGKPVLWSTIQFLNHGMLGDDVDISVRQTSGGRSIVQATATVSRGDTTLQTMIAALGERSGVPDQQFAVMPEIPPPQDCPEKVDNSFGQPSNLIGQFERRTALENTDSGSEHMWIRPKFETKISASLLALVSDFFLGAHKRSRGGTSLDNTIRICSLKQSDWILCVTSLSGFTNGAVHGMQQQFAEDGTLLSLSSQTGLLPRTPNP